MSTNNRKTARNNRKCKNQKSSKETLRQLLKKQKEQENSIAKVLEELQSIRDELGGSGPKLEELTIETSENQEIAPPPSKQFRLIHTFQNVSKMKPDAKMFSKTEDHFGVPWCLVIIRNDDFLAVYAKCERSLQEPEPWSIEVELGLKLIGSPKNSVNSTCSFCNTVDHFDSRGISKFVKLEEIEDTVTFESHIRIIKMTGVYKPNLRNFDEKQCSDIELVVQNHKFHVAKLFLAAQSSYFNAMFLGRFGESRKLKIELFGVDPDDFQNYLEVLYGEDAIDDYTIEGILLVADMYDTATVIRRCEEFLLEKSKKALKKKLEMAARYNLDRLRKTCLSEIKTSNDIRAVLPANIRDMDPSLMADLFEKSLASSYY